MTGPVSDLSARTLGPRNSSADCTRRSPGSALSDAGSIPAASTSGQRPFAHQRGRPLPRMGAECSAGLCACCTEGRPRLGGTVVRSLALVVLLMVYLPAHHTAAGRSGWGRSPAGRVRLWLSSNGGAVLRSVLVWVLGVGLRVSDITGMSWFTKLQNGAIRFLNHPAVRFVETLCGFAWWYVGTACNLVSAY